MAEAVMMYCFSGYQHWCMKRVDCLSSEHLHCTSLCSWLILLYCDMRVCVDVVKCKKQEGKRKDFQELGRDGTVIHRPFHMTAETRQQLFANVLTPFFQMLITFSHSSMMYERE